eukprot:13251029-Alexandrium_andersonii.AAC.1
MLGSDLLRSSVGPGDVAILLPLRLPAGAETCVCIGVRTIQPFGPLDLRPPTSPPNLCPPLLIF